MQRNPWPFAGGHHHPNYLPQNPSSSLPIPFNPLVQIPNFSIQNPFPQFNHLQNPYLLNPSVPLQSNPSPSPLVNLEQVENTVVKARHDLVNAGESVSAWKVSQAVLVQLKVDSWNSLGFHLLDVPSIRHLTVIEGKVNAFIHCFVNSRGIASLYDLELAMCKNEGIHRFEELGLGPLVRHPIAEHYFSIPSSVTEVFKITSEDIISYLQEFMDKHKRKMIMAQEFLDFVAVQKDVKCKEMLGVRIQNLGLYISHIREARKEEAIILRTLKIRRQNYYVETSSAERDYPQPLGRSTEKEILDKRFGFISKRMKLFSSSWSGFGAKHIRFDSPVDDNNDAADNDAVDYDEKEEENDFNTYQCQNSSTDKESGQFVSSCPYPSTTEEKARLRLKVREKLSSGNGKTKEKGGQSLSGRKRKFKEKNGNAIHPHKSQAKDRSNCSRLNLMKSTIAEFIGRWKEACQEQTITEVVDMMLDFYMSKGKWIGRTKKILSTFPGIGLLNVAVSAIKYGMLDSYHDAPHNIGEHGSVHQSSDPSIDIANNGSSVKENGKAIYLHKSQAKDRSNGSRLNLMKYTDLILPSSDIAEFIGRWKEACQEQTIAEVVDMMLDFYMPKGKRIGRTKNILSTFPGIGLLNVTVSAIRMLDSHHDAPHNIGEHGSVHQNSDPSIDIANNGSSVKENTVFHANKSVEKPGHGVTVDAIIKMFTEYLECNHLPHKELDSPYEGELLIYKKFCDCEAWLTSQYSVKEFSSFGQGSFCEFLEKHFSLLPIELGNFFMSSVQKQPRGDVSMLQEQLGIFLSQAESNLKEDGITTKYISMLLRKQFPMISFCITGNEPEKCFLDLIKKQKDNSHASCVVFSSTLLGENSSRNYGKCFQNLSESTEYMDNVGHKKISYGTSSAKDAIECLLKAPMLSDLLSWSHWDSIYAPSLGSLLEWLLNDVNAKELSCIVTIDGKFVRIDPSATVDEFLEALIHCSSFQLALKLLSLVSVYRGTSNAPLSLLKCFVKRAINIIMRNYVEDREMNVGVGYLMHNNSIEGQGTQDKFAERYSTVDFLGTPVTQGNELSQDLLRAKRALNSVSRLILDCLSHLPSEFRTFAADILGTGFRSVNKDAHLLMLQECFRTDQRIMLHEIGLSLGVTEWIEDFHLFNSTIANDLFVSSKTLNSVSHSSLGIDQNQTTYVSEKPACSNIKLASEARENYELVEVHQIKNNTHSEDEYNVCGEVKQREDLNKISVCKSSISGHGKIRDAALIVESIRRDEFGLDPNCNSDENFFLKKQHDRLGRALHCLSQELYSQDSHLLLELVQNADDNVYSEYVDPTLVFILQDTGIVVLNNEQGFSGENIKALCDIGNSTKKRSGAGYIGHKGIGFKSVFRVTDAPEIHSNGFHVKFDITEGQIGFILPTVISPCDIEMFKRLLSGDKYECDNICWNTCILLPFRSKFRKGPDIRSIISMFSDLHPSLLLFLHRLRCIKFRSMLDNSLVIMRKETLANGIVEVSHGKEKMSWLVVNKKLQASVIRPEVQSTEIAIAFTLQETKDGKYKPHLVQQPVFAFLPLRKYGLKFILQGDFVLPSSREEVDGDSAWNQWLLAEFPALFVSAEQSFCALPCFEKNPGMAVTAYMSFVPLLGEVHGFFSHLPHMIISKLRMSSCLVSDGPELEWVLPCRVLRGWDDQARLLISDYLLQKHLGLYYLNRDVSLSDTLAKALGVQDYGLKVLVDAIQSICRTSDGIKLMGLDWLSLWLHAVYSTLSGYSSGHLTFNTGFDYDLINCLKKIPFIPLSDGSYSSTAEGPIWLPCDALNNGLEKKHSYKDFPNLYAKLRIVDPCLLLATSNTHVQETRNDCLIQVLRKIGVQELSAHEVITSHILVYISDDKYSKNERKLMVEYISFILHHFQHACASCDTEKADIISKLRKRPVLLTNHGYHCTEDVPVHFSKEYGNPVDIGRLIGSTNAVWHEIDVAYLMHPATQSSAPGLMKWRSFFQELGVTDFVQVNSIRKNLTDVFHTVPGSMVCLGDTQVASSYISDWESPELVSLLSIISLEGSRDKCIFLLDVLDKMWDDCYSSKSRSYILSGSNENKKPIESSFMKNIREFKWIASTLDDKLHHSEDLFYDSEEVRSIFGNLAPYAVPQVTSKLLLENIGFKTQVTLDDALAIFSSWRMSKPSLVTSTAQMSKFYAFISDKIENLQITKDFVSSPFIFIPFDNSSRCNDGVPGILLSSKDVYWHDPTGCTDKMMEISRLCTSVREIGCLPCKALTTIYPGLHDFFVKTCGVPIVPPFGSYLPILLQLSTVSLPSQSAYLVFRVFLKWSDDLNSGLVKTEELVDLKENLLKLENTILPTLGDKWVSLHPSHGLLCWSDDEKLKQQFKHYDGVEFLNFGELNNQEKEVLSGKVAKFLQKLGVRPLSQVVSREAIFYGMTDNKEKASLINWLFPFAQRYLYKQYPDVYINLKELGFEKLTQLQVVAVEKLFYKYTLKGCDSTSNKRFECACLLQGNIFYVSHTSDYHTMFLEFSRLFFSGSAELHLANFLHMITTMADSGSTMEQTEFFVVNSQKVPKLPAEETVWYLSSLSTADSGEALQPISTSPMNITQNVQKCPRRKPGISPNWPPTDWKTAPDFNYSINNHLRTRPLSLAPHDGPKNKLCKSVENSISMEDLPVPIEIEGDFLIEEDLLAKSTIVSRDSALVKGKVDVAENFYSTDWQIHSDLDVENKLPYLLPTRADSSTSPEKGRLSWHTPDENQSRRTGRLGEFLSYNYFTEKLGSANVKWVNEETETGLPYDLIIGETEESREYIEVKTTKSANKDWFEISTREWEFASLKGDTFSIAHVVLLSQKKAKITILKNPLKLCQQKALHLTVLMSKQLRNSSTPPLMDLSK
ncbi:hypothetical protein J5N97_008249 [Dioscorea zingiberensis]|uniref:Protein NO VEIN C-terminal domain-containing protein n=1 Tax=Dioscorea zingiberensis TaxID=325984 RepID=A0A9D5DDH0_9LILI|nr:hypothetical protein J5N97_008249 [Dioscorea zingiberensis]